MDVSRLIWYRTTLEHVAREATRFAAVRAGSATKSSVEAFMYNRLVGMPYSDLAVDVTWSAGNVSGSAVTVSLTYTFDPIVANFLPLGQMELSSSSTMVIS